MKRSLKWFAVLTTIGMLFVLIGGALVTKTESGAGCGTSWPLCNGKLIPTEITPELIIELSHRVVSGSVGLMVLILSIWSWKAIGHIRETKFLAFISFFFLLLQGLIGAAAVVWGQSDAVLALHFGVSLISFASVLLLTLLIFEVDKKFDADSLVIDRKMRNQIYAISIYSYIVVYSGALVRHMNASLACPDWPVCNYNQLGLPTQIHEWVQMGHRILAGGIFIWILLLTIHTIKHYKHEKVLYWGWIFALILVSLQVSSGAIIVFTNLNLFVALAHALFISCLFGVFSYLILLSSRSKKNEAALQSKNASKQEDVHQVSAQ
ncbi:COX15/CtaA family protein [Ferdinandcohnia quinoae]|uniref:Heme A synthase n=1 Tax=Fredinandcohnia quinoae TaxID=2918902 RepID=A0AAW5E1D3_9BACI|nr:heme A synthase [Fredinandcohnia sp. SECRCQ15]MCH1623922.1 heme A synthase [Fredinandcohnia sp. SECRCQ15]